MVRTSRADRAFRLAEAGHECGYGSRHCMKNFFTSMLGALAACSFHHRSAAGCHPPLHRLPVGGDPSAWQRRERRRPCVGANGSYLVFDLAANIHGRAAGRGVGGVHGASSAATPHVDPAAPRLSPARSAAAKTDDAHRGPLAHRLAARRRAIGSGLAVLKEVRERARRLQGRGQARQGLPRLRRHHVQTTTSRRSPASSRSIPTAMIVMPGLASRADVLHRARSKNTASACRSPASANTSPPSSPSPARKR